MTEASFDDTWLQLETVDGWMSREQGALLDRAARQVPENGVIVEIGSFHGRSTIVLGAAALASASIIAVDPHAGSDRGPQEIAAQPELGVEDFERFTANIEAAGLTERITHLRMFSDQALAAIPDQIDLLYVDGAHRFGPARADIANYGARIAPGGTMLVHDSFSSIGVTLALLSTTTISNEWSYLGRAGSLAEYRRRGNAGGAFRNATKQLAELPWFFRNVAIKAAITVGRPSIARRLGHDPELDGPWPF